MKHKLDRATNEILEGLILDVHNVYNEELYKYFNLYERYTQ